MNLSEALDAVLPEIPQARLTRSRPPRIDPELVVHEGVLDGEPFVGILHRGCGSYFRFTPSQWALAQLFDGNRSYEEIAELWSAETGAAADPEEARGFGEQMDACGISYQSYQEKNLAMRDKLLAQRERRAKSKINLAHISFSAWDPDRYFDWLNGVAGRFIYSKWAVLSAVMLFVFEAVVVVDNWRFMGPDTAMFFNFAQKSFAEFARFWVLLLIVGFLHETAHGLTCKHFGGQVHSMGLMFLYLVPCFFVDVTESWVSAAKLQRLATIIAGIWVELVLCAIAMIFWLNSAEGGLVHTVAYEVILLTGIAAVVVNLNPLLKLDGYYFLTEVIEIPELKERSTAFVSAWFQARVLGLPVEIPIVPRRRVGLFVCYALASGAYSYLMLFFVVRLAYSLGTRWSAEFAVIPAAAIGILMFRSRLRSLRRVLKESWQRTIKPRLRWRPVYALAGLGLLALLFVPLWRDRLDGYFVIEPAETHTVCAAVPGRVEAVLVQEGQQVHSGQPLLEMTSFQAASMRSSALAQTRSARFRTFDAQLQGRSIGSAAGDQLEAQRMTVLAHEAQSTLEVTAPADGTVLTEDPAQLADEDVGYGQPLLQMAEGSRIARVYIPASALGRIAPDSEVSLALPGRFSMVRLKLPPPAGEPVALPGGLVATEKYLGIKTPVFYASRIPLSATAGNPMFGLSGRAIVFGLRRSVAGRMIAALSDLVEVHIWW